MGRAGAIVLEIADAAIDFIAESGYDPVYGARPLKRAIQRLLENPIATEILETTFAQGGYHRGGLVGWRTGV